MLYTRLKNHLRENLAAYCLLLISFSLGLGLGQAEIQLLPEPVGAELQQELERSVPAGFSQAVFWQAFFPQLKSMLLVWFLGMTLIGSPLILGVLFYRGISLGFTFHWLFHLRSWKGLGLFLASVLPQNLIYLPCLGIWSVLALKLSGNILRNIRRKKKKPPVSFPSLFLKYQLLLPVFLCFTAAGAVVEAWFAPRLFSWLVTFV